MSSEKNFEQDVEFLRQHVETIVLRNDEGAAVAVVPQYQGRTMTSSANGDGGTSFGWINYEQVAAGNTDPQVNLFGGEDRLWISPEGGQFSVFFDPDAPMDFANWRTPAPIDTEAFELVTKTDTTVAFTHRAKLMNYSRFEFDLRFDRVVELISKQQAETVHQCSFGDTHIVAHVGHNTVTNVSQQPWKQETGLIAIWSLCMSKPSDSATIIVPFKKGDPAELGSIVNADYFGKLENDRLAIDEDSGLIFFLGDGKLRSKLGLTFARVQPFLGSYDAQRNVLTIVDFNLPESAPHGYTNNLWEIQDEPFAGDVINSYNDGPNESGGMLGPFYELETVSPALALEPGQAFTHVVRTIRIEGRPEKLDPIAQAIFGVSLEIINSQFHPVST